MSGFGGFVDGLFSGAKSMGDLMEQKNRLYWQYDAINTREVAKAAIEEQQRKDAAARAAGVTPAAVTPPGSETTPPPPEANPAVTTAPTPKPAEGTGGSPDLKDRVAGWVSWRESSNRPYVGFEGSASKEEKEAAADILRYGEKPGYAGFPNWPGNIDSVTGQRSFAAGLFGFTPETWKRYAVPLGITDFSPESQKKVFDAAYLAEGIRPWQGNRELIADLGNANLLGGAATDPARKAPSVPQGPATPGSPSATAGDKPQQTQEGAAAAKAKADEEKRQAAMKPVANALASVAPQKQPDIEPPMSALSIPSPASFTPSFTRAAAADPVGSSMASSSALTGSSYSPTPVTPYSPQVRPVLAGLRQSEAAPMPSMQQASLRPPNQKTFRMPNGTLVDGIGNIIRPGPSALYPRDRENA